jgi:hypothetical protein
MWLQTPLRIWENILRGNERGRELWFGRVWWRVARAWSKQDNCGHWLQSSQWAKVHALGQYCPLIHLEVQWIAQIWMGSHSAETPSWSWGQYSIYYSFSFCSVGHLLCRLACMLPSHVHTQGWAVYVTNWYWLLIFFTICWATTPTTNQDFIEKLHTQIWL